MITFQKSDAYIILKEDKISTIDINIGGSVKILMADIPANIEIEICFK